MLIGLKMQVMQPVRSAAVHNYRLFSLVQERLKLTESAIWCQPAVKSAGTQSWPSAATLFDASSTTKSAKALTLAGSNLRWG